VNVGSARLQCPPRAAVWRATLPNRRRCRAGNPLPHHQLDVADEDVASTAAPFSKRKNARQRIAATRDEGRRYRQRNSPQPSPIMVPSFDLAEWMPCCNVSDIAWSRVKNKAAHVLSVGQQIERKSEVSSAADNARHFCRHEAVACRIPGMLCLENTTWANACAHGNPRRESARSSNWSRESEGLIHVPKCHGEEIKNRQHAGKARRNVDARNSCVTPGEPPNVAGIEQALGDPWADRGAEVCRGTSLKVQSSASTKFGAFVQLSKASRA